MKKLIVILVIITVSISMVAFFLYRVRQVEKVSDKSAKIVFFNEAVKRYNSEKTDTYNGFVKLYRDAYEQSYAKILAPEHEKIGIEDEITHLESVVDPAEQAIKLKKFKQISKVNSFLAKLASESYKADKMVEGFLKARQKRLARVQVVS